MTMREHASIAPNEACTTCHRGHAFAEVRDPAWLAASLRVEAAIVDGKVRVTLAQTRPGHAFPTGDLFRRLAVTIDGQTQYLARRLEVVPGRAGRQLVGDDRVFADPVVVEMPATNLGARIPWSVRLDRVAQVGAGTNGANATVESSVLLHSGLLENSR